MCIIFVLRLLIYILYVMPRGDKTGPLGNGPKTGSALGYCIGNNHAEIENTINSRRNGRGFGQRNRNRKGLGKFIDVRNVGLSTLVDVSEKTLIENEINILKD